MKAEKNPRTYAICIYLTGIILSMLMHHELGAFSTEAQWVTAISELTYSDPS